MHDLGTRAVFDSPLEAVWKIDPGSLRTGQLITLGPISSRLSTTASE
jgi:hypothetical protein